MLSSKQYSCRLWLRQWKTAWTLFLDSKFKTSNKTKMFCMCLWAEIVTALLIIPSTLNRTSFLYTHNVINLTAQRLNTTKIFYGALQMHFNCCGTCKANCEFGVKSDKMIMLLWLYKLDSDKWITKRTGAIRFSSSFSQQELLGVLFDADTKITAQWLFAFIVWISRKVLLTNPMI